jgi:hypothetical protein
METKPYSLQSPEAIAKEYGGNKQKIAQATQSGLLDPTAAVMAGMFIDRMRNAQMEEQAPVQTVAQDVLAPQQMPQQMGGQMPQGMPPEMAGQMPQQMPQGAGLEALPVPDQMFDGPSMASGGLVAFSDAGRVSSKEDRDRIARENRKFLLESVKPSGAALLDVLGLPVRALGSGAQYLQDRKSEIGIPSFGPDLRDLGLTLEGSPTPFYDRYVRQPEEARAEELTQVTDLGTPDQTLSLGDPQLPEVVVEAELPPEVPPQPKADTPTAPTAAPAQQAPQGSALDEYARMLMGTLQDKETSKADARNMALLQAGLGIMGGESQYALQNIARGALPATQAYQQQMAAGRKEERETLGALADLELKAKELGLTEKRYADLVRIAEMQVGAAAGKSGAAADKTLLTAQINLAKEIMSGGMVSADQAMTEAARLIGLAGKDPTDTKAAIKYVPGKGYVANQ